MKKLYRIVLTGIIAGSSIFANAQIGNVTQILRGGPDDAPALMKAYMEPLARGYSLGLTNGWYNTAKVHKMLGFDLTITGGIAMVPSSLKSFTLPTLKNLYAPTVAKSPTFAGSASDKGADLSFKQVVGADTFFRKISLPRGTGIGFAPSMIIQGAIGLPLGNEIMIRFSPAVNFGKYGSIGLWGIGIKHDLKQWIPVINNTPFWSLSGMLAYTSFTNSSKGTYLEPDPRTYYIDIAKSNIFKNQGVEIIARAFTGNLILSTNIPVINVYCGIGFARTSSEINFTGNYPVPGPPTAANILNNAKGAKMNAQGVKIKSLVYESQTNLRSNIGLRLKLVLVTIHADVAWIDGYSMYSGGLGINFR